MDYLTHADLEEVHERINVVSREIGGVRAQIENHESACTERWKHQDHSNEVVEKLNAKLNYLSGGMAVIIFAATLLAQWLLK